MYVGDRVASGQLRPFVPQANIVRNTLVSCSSNLARDERPLTKNKPPSLE